MNWAVYLAVALLAAQWALSVLIYQWVHGSRLRLRYAWAANGLLLFRWRARRWEHRSTPGWSSPVWLPQTTFTNADWTSPTVFYNTANLTWEWKP